MATSHHESCAISARLALCLCSRGHYSIVKVQVSADIPLVWFLTLFAIYKAKFGLFRVDDRITILPPAAFCTSTQVFQPTFLILYLQCLLSTFIYIAIYISLHCWHKISKCYSYFMLILYFGFSVVSFHVNAATVGT